MPEALDIAEDESVRGYDDLDKQHSDRKKNKRICRLLNFVSLLKSPFRNSMNY